jgi:hypothetical protein
MFEATSERLVDEVIESYVCWREACAGVVFAYDRWQTARYGERKLHGAAHGAALDREQHAALMYAQAIARLAARQPLEAHAPQPT